MAESNDKTPAAAQAAKGKLPIKTAAILLAVLLIEGAAISCAFLLAGGPAEVLAQGAAEDRAAQLEQPVETLVVADKFQNTRTGRSYLYDTEIYIVVKQKYLEEIEAKIEAMKAQITTEVATIFRRAEPAHLLEPELGTLTRQVRAALDEQLGYGEDGEPYIQEVLIKKCMQFRADL